MIDKNSKAYKKARRQKAIAYGASVRRANKAIKEKARAERAAMPPTEKALKTYVCRRRDALTVLRISESDTPNRNGSAILYMGNHYKNPDLVVKWVQQNADLIRETPDVRTYSFYKVAV